MNKNIFLNTVVAIMMLLQGKLKRSLCALAMLPALPYLQLPDGVSSSDLRKGTTQHQLYCHLGKQQNSKDCLIGYEAWKL